MEFARVRWGRCVYVSMGALGGGLIEGMVLLFLLFLDMTKIHARNRGVAFDRLAASSKLSRFSIGDLCVSRQKVV